MRFLSTGVPSYDLCQLQYHLFCEQLVRKHCGSVHRRGFSLKPIGDSSVEHAFTLLSSISKVSHCKVLEGGVYARFFLSNKWSCRFGLDIQVGGSDDKPTVKEECEKSGSSGGAVAGNPIVRTIEVEIYSVDSYYFESIEKLCKQAGYRVISGFDVTDGIPVVFAWPSKNGIDYRQQSFSRLKLQEVSENYSSDVIGSVEKLLEYARNVTHGLVVINGPVGTGKSYLIRSILSELTQRRAVVCIPATQFLEEAGLLTQVVANFQKSIIVLEDIGEVIAIDAAARYVDARANLLNFTEGFLSLLTDAIIIISFNYDIEKIDPAVLRPGRCLARIEINELPYEHAYKLVNFEIPKRKYSLAEIYEIRRVGNLSTIKEHSKVGFS
jgi:hypothetical protein